MSAKPLAVLDIGSTKVACVIARPMASAGYEILGTGIAAYPTLPRAWPCEVNLLARAIEQAAQDAKTELPERAIITLTHPDLCHASVTAQIDIADEPSVIRSYEIDRLQRQAVSQSLGLDHDVLWLEPLAYDGNGFNGVRDPRQLAATRLRGRFQLISMPVALRHAVTQAAEAAGFEVERWVWSLQALIAACQQEGLASRRALIIDIGGLCTDLAVIEQGRIITSASVPWGGSAIALELASTARLTVDQALALSLEGLSSSNPLVRDVVERQLASLQGPIESLLSGQPLPDAALITGRGALVDGVVEWIEMLVKTNTTLGRGGRAKGLGDLGRQVGLSAASGVLELRFGQSAQSPRRRADLVHRLVDRTRNLLVEYF